MPESRSPGWGTWLDSYFALIDTPPSPNKDAWLEWLLALTHSFSLCISRRGGILDYTRALYLFDRNESVLLPTLTAKLNSLLQVTFEAQPQRTLIYFSDVSWQPTSIVRWRVPENLRLLWVSRVLSACLNVWELAVNLMAEWMEVGVLKAQGTVHID